MELLLLFGIWIAPLYLFVQIIVYWRKRQSSTDRRSPLTRGLLRSPGQTISEQLDEARLDTLGYMSVGAAGPLLAYAMYLADRLHRPEPSTLIIWMCALTGAFLWGFCLFKANRLIKERIKLQLGYEAEVAAAQELNTLAHDGYWVFHDFPAEKFNIDHVVVGPSGVYAVETKGRPKRTGGGDNKGWEVLYDGRSLKFPEWTETAPLQQAARQAKWLKEWLSSAVGEPLQVEPVLMLPGWYVRRTASEGIAVLNPKNAGGYFNLIAKQTLSEKLIKQIVHQLDQRCRNVAPKAYSAPEE
ncbi:MAG: nuclease-related domain-containing protein [Denitratisoma sp.]|nr:nuclease-related domain-containing protein [Denitratisoma sp.]